MYLKLKMPNIHKMTTESLMLAIKGTPGYYDTQICHLSCTLFLFDIFQVQYIIRPRSNFFFNLCSCHRCNMVFFQGRTTFSRSQKILKYYHCEFFLWVLTKIWVTASLLRSLGWPSQLGCCRRVRLPQRVSWIYDTKQSDGEASVMLELWEMQSAPSLPSLPGPLWPGVVAPDRVLCMG